MGQIRNIKGVYYIEFHARGLLYSQVAGNNLEDAQKLLEQVESKIAGGEALTIMRHIDLPDFFERYIAEAKALHFSPVSIKRVTGTIEHFNKFLNTDFPQVRQLSQLTPAILESYKCYLAKEYRPKIVNLNVLLIRDVLDFGIKLGFINDNPSLHVRLLAWPKSPERKLTERYNKAKQLLAQGVGISKIAHLLRISDISRIIYYSNLIPLSRENEFN